MKKTLTVLSFVALALLSGCDIEVDNRDYSKERVITAFPNSKIYRNITCPRTFLIIKDDQITQVYDMGNSFSAHEVFMEVKTQ